MTRVGALSNSWPQIAGDASQFSAGNLIYRTPLDKDLDDVENLLCHSAVAERFSPWSMTGSGLPPVDWFASLAPQSADPDPRIVAVNDAAEADKAVIGAVCIENASLSYFVRPDWWGIGVGSALVNHACVRALVELGLSRLGATVDRDNHASRKVLERNDFSFAGLTHLNGQYPHQRMAILTYRRILAL